MHNRAFAFTKETLAELAKSMPEPYSVAVKIGAATGLRPSELMGLSKQDIDFQNSVIRLSLQDATLSGGPLARGPLKTRWSRRSISFGPELRALLLPLYNSPGPDGRLFHEDGKMRVWKFRYIWREVKLLLPEIGPGWHQLRHYHASVLIAHGFSPVAVAARLGHKDANETLRTYSHMWDNDSSNMAEIADAIVAAYHR